MRKSILLTGLFAGLSVPLAVRAQSQLPPDSAQMVAILAVVLQESKPAAFVLQHRAALELTPTQVAALEALVQAQRDSAVARQARYASWTQANPPSAAVVAASSWTGEIDESALRDEMCQQSAKTTVDAMLRLARDRRATAALLTTVQVAQLPFLAMVDMMSPMKRP